MAAAWLEHLLGRETALRIRGMVEVSARSEHDDEWAEYWGATSAYYNYDYAIAG